MGQAALIFFYQAPDKDNILSGAFLFIMSEKLGVDVPGLQPVGEGKTANMSLYFAQQQILFLFRSCGLAF